MSFLWFKKYGQIFASQQIIFKFPQISVSMTFIVYIFPWYTFRISLERLFDQITLVNLKILKSENKERNSNFSSKIYFPLMFILSIRNILTKLLKFKIAIFLLSHDHRGSPINILAVLPIPPKTFSMSPDDKLLMREAKAKWSSNRRSRNFQVSTKSADLSC